MFSEGALNYNGKILITTKLIELKNLLIKGIDSRKELAEVAVELQTDVPDISECDYSHNTVSLLSRLSSYHRNYLQFKTDSRRSFIRRG